MAGNGVGAYDVVQDLGPGVDAVAVAYELGVEPAFLAEGGRYRLHAVFLHSASHCFSFLCVPVRAGKARRAVLKSRAEGSLTFGGKVA